MIIHCSEWSKLRLPSKEVIQKFLDLGITFLSGENTNPENNIETEIKVSSQDSLIN